MIPESILTKYHIGQPDDYETAADFYQTLLAQTDHIPNKIIEAQVLGEPAEDYSEILQARKEARAELNRLEV